MKNSKHKSSTNTHASTREWGVTKEIFLVFLATSKRNEREIAENEYGKKKTKLVQLKLVFLPNDGRFCYAALS